MSKKSAEVLIQEAEWDLKTEMLHLMANINQFSGDMHPDLFEAVGELYEFIDNLKPAAWRREWEGDISDLGNMIYEDDEEHQPDGCPWEPLYSMSSVLVET